MEYLGLSVHWGKSSQPMKQWRANHNYNMSLLEACHFPATSLTTSFKQNHALLFSSYALAVPFNAFITNCTCFMCFLEGYVRGATLICLLCVSPVSKTVSGTSQAFNRHSWPNATADVLCSMWNRESYQFSSIFPVPTVLQMSWGPLQTHMLTNSLISAGLPTI